MASYISVILTSKDRYPLIRMAVQSVLSQSFQDFELIIVDDDSQNSELLDYLADLERHPKITVIPTHIKDRKDLKMVAVMANIGLDAARGKYVSYICDDDVWMPDKLSNAVAHLGEYDMVVDAVEWFDVNGERTPEKKLSFNYPRPFENGHWKLLDAIDRTPNYICHDCVVHRKTIQRWPIDDLHPVPVDWRFWLALFHDGFRIKKIRSIGAEAYRPGVWREGLTMDEALKSRNLEGVKAMNKNKIRYAKNISGKIQILNDGNLKVYPKERVEIAHVTSPSGALYPGFVYDASLDIPEIAKIASEPAPHTPKTPEPVAEFKHPNAPDTPKSVLVQENSKVSFKKVEKPKVEKPKVEKPKAETKSKPAKKSKPEYHCSVCKTKLSGPTKTGMCRSCYNKNRKG
jgi:glycosyltransferase involved in cell wall biosynthesis